MVAVCVVVGRSSRPARGDTCTRLRRRTRGTTVSAACGGEEARLFRVSRVELSPQGKPAVVLCSRDLPAGHVCSGVPSGTYRFLKRVSDGVVHLIAAAPDAEGVAREAHVNCTINATGVLECDGNLAAADDASDGTTSVVVVRVHNALDDDVPLPQERVVMSDESVPGLPTPHRDVAGDYVERSQWAHHEHSVGRVRRAVPAVVNCSLNLQRDGLVCEGLPTGDYLMKSVSEEVVHAGVDAHVGSIDALGRLIIPEDPLNRDSEIKARMTESGILLVSGLPRIPGISEPAIRARMVHIENLETLCEEGALVDQTVMHCPLQKLHGIVGVPGVVRRQHSRSGGEMFRTSLYDDESLGLALHLSPMSHPHGHTTRTDPVVHFDDDQ